MKRAVLVKVATYLQNYKSIFAIERVGDTIIKMVFKNKDSLFFDMRKSNSYVFRKENYFRQKEYQAPFDVVLKKIFAKSVIQDVIVEDGNRILKIFVESNLRYKKEINVLQFEFTGKNTNVIILNEQNIVQEALRQISINNSFREVRVGKKLLALPPIEIKEKSIKVEDIEKFLYDEFFRVENQKLKQLKMVRVKSLEKKVKNLTQTLLKVENSEALEQNSQKIYNQANLILSNLHKIKPYQKKIEVINYEGESEIITFPKDVKSPTQMVNILFNQAKKLKQKAKNSHLEIANLNSKIKFLDSLINIINKTKSIDELDIYFPKKQNRVKKEIIDSNVEIFFYENYKIMVGKNSKGNEKILKDARKNDIWLHIKDIPSSHVIIRTDKQNIKDEIIEFGAKLCLDFTTQKSGKYEIDYTQRRNVKIAHGSNVNYINYKSLILHI